jgi:hypothetical protein
MFFFNFFRIENNSFSKYHFRGTCSEDKNSRSRHKMHMGTLSTCSWSPYLSYCTWQSLVKVILTSNRTEKTYDFWHFPFARYFWLVEECENWSMMGANDMMHLFCWSLYCGSVWSLGRYAIHRNHGVAARAGTQKQHLSSRWLPPRRWAFWR